MIRILIKITLVLLLLFTLSCDREDSYVSEVNYISYGTSFGECLGYCNQFMKVYPQIATLSQFGWDESGELPEIQCSLPLESHEFISIRDSVDVGNFFSLDETYGCPDCADGGAEWVEISFDTLKHRVTFEFLNEPEELTPIVTVLRELMLEFEGCDQ
jgi:hypothetical protein